MMTAGEKLYDAVMRLPIVALTLYFMGREMRGIRGLVATHPYFSRDWPLLMTLASRASVVIFLAVPASLHASRRRPVGKHADWLRSKPQSHMADKKLLCFPPSTSR